MKSILIGFLFVNMVNSRAQPTEMIIEEFNKLIKTCKQAAIPGSFECSGNQKPNFYPQNACSDLMPEMRWPEYWPSHSPTPKSYETLCNGFDSVSYFFRESKINYFFHEIKNNYFSREIENDYNFSLFFRETNFHFLVAMFVQR